MPKNPNVKKVMVIGSGPIVKILRTEYILSL